MRIVKGTPVQEVSAAELADEVRIYGEAGLDQNVSQKLRDMRKAHRRGEGQGQGSARKRDASHMMHELVGSLRSLIQ